MASESSTLEREVESKFEIPFKMGKAYLMLMVGNIAAREGWHLTNCKYEELFFQYFDTPQLDAYKNGDTIRRVSGFPAASNAKATYRYDFKIGPIDNRLEKNHWDDQQYTPQELVSVLELPPPYASLMVSASANTNHQKMFFEKDGSRVEVTQDIFNVHDGLFFRELEIELKKGNQVHWRELSDKVRTELGLKAVHSQKYSTIIEGMPRYNDRIQ